MLMKISRVACCTMLCWSLAHTSCPAELVAHWPLNEVDTDVFVDRAGGNDGFVPEDVFVEFADDGPPGIFDTSVFFTGDEGPSYIETPFVGIGGADPRTIALWVKAEPQTRATALVTWGPNTTAEKWHFRIEDTRIRTEYSGGQKFGGDTDIADGEWHHVASVFPEGGFEGEDIIHYVDGEVEPHLGGTSIPINTVIDPDLGADPVFIGFASVHAGRWFQGQMSDVRIYDEGLDQDAIRAVMAGAGLGPPGEPGDFNGDGVVDMADFAILRDNFGGKFSVEESYSKGDFDTNTRVDLKDFRAFRNLFNQQQGVAAAVPEPHAITLLGLASTLLLTLRRRT